jgi:hypothetical protein
MRKLQQIVVLVVACILTGAAGAQVTDTGAPVTSSGTINFIPKWTGTTTLGNSVLFQSGTGSTAKIGINTTAPASTLDVKGGATVRGGFSLPAQGTATATAGFISYTLSLSASVFNSAAGLAVPQNFRWQAEPVDNDTVTATGSLNLLFSEGTAAPSETGLHIASNGRIKFATGQTFPGAGTVTSVGSGLGLMGGPITTSGTLAIDPTVVPQLNKANTFTGDQTVNGNVSVVGGVISVGGSRALSCTSLTKAIGSIPTGFAST